MADKRMLKDSRSPPSSGSRKPNRLVKERLSLSSVSQQRSRPTFGAMGESRGGKGRLGVWKELLWSVLLTGFPFSDCSQPRHVQHLHVEPTEAGWLSHPSQGLGFTKHDFLQLSLV